MSIVSVKWAICKYIHVFDFYCEQLAKKLEKKTRDNIRPVDLRQQITFKRAPDSSFEFEFDTLTN